MWWHECACVCGLNYYDFAAGFGHDVIQLLLTLTFVSH